jgi:putative methylase
VPRDPVAKAFAGSNPAPRNGIAPRPRTPLTHRQLVIRLAKLPGPPSPDPALEQVPTPPERAAELLLGAWQRGDIEGRSVADLGTGTGVLALGAALLGARSVVGWEVDPACVTVARAYAEEWRLPVVIHRAEVREATGRVDTVVMNPPFGAQREGADREFWAAAFRLRPRRVYGFALEASRSFIARRAVEADTRILDLHPVPWELPALFPHHRARSRPLKVDLWVLERSEGP